MGSIPTLKPLLSQMQGHMPCIGSYALSKKRSTRVSKITTARSKSSNRFQHRGHGDVTIALDEIDNMTRQQAGSSTESILVTSKEEATVKATTSQASGSPRHSPPPSPRMQPVETPAAAAAAAAASTTTTITKRLPSPLWKDRPSRDVSADCAIQVQRDFTIGYDEHSKQDTIAFERSKRP